MIQLNGIKPQVYLDTSTKKNPVVLPKSNYRGDSTKDFAINRFNDHNVILFGRNSRSQEINFFEFLLKHKRIIPEDLVKKTLEEKNVIGEGREAEIFKIPLKGFENFLLRRNKWDRCKNVDSFSLNPTDNPFQGIKNISSIIATIGPYQIINKIEGKGLDAPLDSIRANDTLKTRLKCAIDGNDEFYFHDLIWCLEEAKELSLEEKTQLKKYYEFKSSYLNQLQTISELPVSNYVKMLEDIKLIYEEGFGLDYSPSNLFYNANTRQIGFIDLDSEPNRDFDISKLAEILILKQYTPFIDFNTIKNGETSCQKIAKKLHEASIITNTFDQSAFNRITYNVGIEKI